MHHRRSMERNYPIRSPERSNRDRYHESRDRHARSPISPLNRKRTPDKHEDYQNKSKKKTSANRISRSRSASSNNSSKGPSDSGSECNRRPHTKIRNQSPRRVSVDNRNRR